MFYCASITYYASTLLHNNFESAAVTSNKQDLQETKAEGDWTKTREEYVC